MSFRLHQTCPAHLRMSANVKDLSLDFHTRTPSENKFHAAFHVCLSDYDNFVSTKQH